MPVYIFNILIKSLDLKYSNIIANSIITKPDIFDLLFLTAETSLK